MALDKGLLIIISGPSGVGKKTILDMFINKPELNLCYSISVTTRKPRQNEKHGIDYFFVSNEQFDEMIANNQFLEWAEFANNKYGTPLNNVKKNLLAKKNVILEIEVQGAEEVMTKLENIEYISIFIVPPSLKELKKRLYKRNTETKQKIKLRLKKAKKELKTVAMYDYCVVNDNVNKAAFEVENIIRKYINENEK